jgi:NitT/TauT family transport system permease protein
MNIGSLQQTRFRLPSIGLPGMTVLLPVGTALLFFALWQMTVTVLAVPAPILPSPTAILGQIIKHFGLLLHHAMPTTFETLVAFGIAIPIGIGIAAIMTLSDFMRLALYPNVILFQIIPKIALAPLFIVWLGIGMPARVTFAVFLSFFPILIATVTGLRSVGADMLRLCLSVKAPIGQVLWKVQFPAALPQIFSGMKIGVTLAPIGVVVGEFIASERGLGYLILFASSRQETALSLACIALLCVMGLGLYGLLAAAERVALRLFGDH